MNELLIVACVVGMIACPIIAGLVLASARRDGTIDRFIEAQEALNADLAAALEPVTRLKMRTVEKVAEMLRHGRPL